MAKKNPIGIPRDPRVKTEKIASVEVKGKKTKGTKKS